MSLRPRHHPWLPGLPESCVMACLCALYAFGFGPLSPAHSALEIFGQDSYYLIESLWRGGVYPWNPQNHLLHHILLDSGYRVWQFVFSADPLSAFHYLKLFTVLSGLLFLVALRRLLLELRLGSPQRCALLLLTGVALPVWFHFSAFETHCLAVTAVVLYLLALAKLRVPGVRSPGARALFIVSLLAAGWLRTDLFRFAAASAVLPLLPALRLRWREWMLDLAIVAVLGLAGSAVMAWGYLGVRPDEVLSTLLMRDDCVELEQSLERPANLSPGPLLRVGRAVSLYAFAMPVEPRPPGAGIAVLPHYVFRGSWTPGQLQPSSLLFHQPARNLLGYALSLLAALGMAGLLCGAAVFSVRRAMAGDALLTMVWVQAITGWLLYTWFNPVEPFLWGLEFVPLWMVTIAESWRDRGRLAWAFLTVTAFLLAAHNLFAFFLPFQ